MLLIENPLQGNVLLLGAILSLGRVQNNRLSLDRVPNQNIEQCLPLHVNSFGSKVSYQIWDFLAENHCLSCVIIKPPCILQLIQCFMNEQNTLRWIATTLGNKFSPRLFRQSTLTATIKLPICLPEPWPFLIFSVYVEKLQRIKTP